MMLLAFALRAGLPLLAFLSTGDRMVFHSLDTDGYTGLASSLVQTGRFTLGGLPEIIRTPGYPMLLVLGTLLGSVETVAVALQVALSCATVYLVYLIGLRLFGSGRTATIGALLYAIEPLSLLFTSKLLTETLFTALTTLFLYFLLRYLDGRSLPALAAAALTLAGTAFVRPIIYYFPILAALLLLWAAGRRGRRQIPAGIASAGLFLLLSVGPLALWQARNAAETGYSGFAAISDINWYFYQGASVAAAKQHVPYYTVQAAWGYSDPAVYDRAHPEQHGWSDAQIYDYMGSEGRRIVLQNLPTYAPIHVIGMLKTLLNPGGVEYLKLFDAYPAAGGDFGVAVNAGLGESLGYLWRENRLLLILDLGFGALLVVYLLAALTALIARANWNLRVASLFALGLYLLVMSGGPQSLSRFRHPIMPLICVLAGYGIAVWLRRLRNAAPRRTPEHTVLQ